MTMFSQPTFAAVPRRYAGVLFRSTLEARWAILFDRLGIEWVWEPERYALPSGSTYLPDFWLPQFDLHAEVKGTEEQWLTDEHRYNEAVLTGALPGRGLMVLGPIPNVIGDNTPIHRVVARDVQRPSGLCIHFELLDWMLQGHGSMACTDVDVVSRAVKGHHRELVTPGYLPGYGRPTELVIEAYDLARSARFEPPLPRVTATTKPVPMEKKTKAPIRSRYAELDAVKAHVDRLEKEIEEENDLQIQADYKDGYCFPCCGQHSRCPAGLLEGMSGEIEPDYDRLIEMEVFPDRAYDEDSGEMIGDPSDYIEEIQADHQCSSDECNVCTVCGCEGAYCDWASNMKDD